MPETRANNPVKIEERYGSGRKLPSIRIVSIASALVFVLILANAAILKQSLDTLLNHQNLVAQTHRVMSEFKDLTTSLRGIESGQRGFVLTMSEHFLDIYHQGRHSATAQILNLLDLTSDNPVQQKRIRSLEEKVKANLDYHTRVIQTARTEGHEAARLIIARGEGLESIAEMNRMIAQITKAEEELLAERGREAMLSRNRVVTTFFAGTVFSLLLVLLAYFIIHRYLNREIAERVREDNESWIKSGIARLSTSIGGEKSVQELCEQVLTFFNDCMHIQLANFYVARDDGTLHLGASFAGQSTINAQPVLQIGEGLAGEAFRKDQPILVTDVPDNYVKVRSTIGEAPPRSLLFIPVSFENQKQGVIELGNFGTFSERDQELAEAVRHVLGVTFVTVQQRARTQKLLEETQLLAEELQAQQEELRVANEELESQSQAALRANGLLSEQKEELRQTNEQLAIQATLLEEKQQALALKNADLVKASEALTQKAHELETASRYKSDFLANMSHELRTPLNSLLILSTLLYENRDGNLNEKQVDFAKTIHRSGNDLLALINDILDLAKIEAGRVNLVVEKVELPEFLAGIDSLFRPLADDKGLAFAVELEPALQQRSISTDKQRLEQILKNLLSNAIKFTHEGEVRLHVHEKQLDGVSHLALDVIDNGVGIPAEKQQIIFEAFQQADTSTSRQYGGTGLGLTISRELAARLGGRIELQSEVGKGSRFTLLIPMNLADQEPASTPKPAPVQVAPSHAVSGPVTARKPERENQPAAANPVGQLLGDLGDVPGRRVLIIEDDRSFGEGLSAVARECGFMAVLATSGEIGLEYAQKSEVDAILLDLRLPDVSGMSLLERLKRDPSTRHLPIHVISGMDYSQNALKMGAFGYLVKPAEKKQLESVFQRIENLLSRSVKRILIVEDDPIQLEAVKNLLSGSDVEIDLCSTGKDALERIQAETYDCMILDLRLPDITGFELLERLQETDITSRPPVVVYTGKDLSADEERELSRYADSIIIKGAKSPERLMDEVSLFLHRIERNLPLDKQTMLQRLRQNEDALDGRHILVVDDDMRNVFALVNALEEHGVTCIVARNGQEALTKLENDTRIELVLMDIMMPIMDGFEATRRIRENTKWRKLPIIALTAKAMKGDQERCLEAGANDYLMKPVNLDKLVSLMKVWLPGRLGG
jgi:CheY-like chemotaxis protein/CHASE3 domain sensor protein/putative methionine-R-sulfoxide reductase with GAF domain